MVPVTPVKPTPNVRALVPGCTSALKVMGVHLLFGLFISASPDMTFDADVSVRVCIDILPCVAGGVTFRSVTLISAVILIVVGSLSGFGVPISMATPE